MAKRLVEYPIENRSGIVLKGNSVKTIKQHCFFPLDISVGGDAPKDVIRMYQYNGICRKDSVKTWPTYIAKIGHKWYPNESITEQLITEIGDLLRIRIANSELVILENVIRFCSQHFHSKDQVLNHGSEILSRYIDEENVEWIDELEKEKRIRAFINVEDVISALKHVFGINADNLIKDFIQMLLFDCLVGNNDRHYYNWGIITHLEGKHKPYFSPIYDSARALWWNSSDEYVISLHNDGKRREARILKYVRNSVPKISIPENEKCNHFELVAYLRKKNLITEEHREMWRSEKVLGDIYELIDVKFPKLMIRERREIIKSTLTIRFQQLEGILK